MVTAEQEATPWAAVSLDSRDSLIVNRRSSGDRALWAIVNQVNQVSQVKTDAAGRRVYVNATSRRVIF